MVHTCSSSIKEAEDRLFSASPAYLVKFRLKKKEKEGGGGREGRGGGGGEERGNTAEQHAQYIISVFNKRHCVCACSMSKC